MPSGNPVGAMWSAFLAILSRVLRFPAPLFVAVLLTDLTYWRTADPLWSTMSSWLLLGGLAWAVIAVLVELVRLLAGARPRRLNPAWGHMLGDGLAVLLSMANFIFHVRDGYSALVPAGPLLSAAVVIILLLTSRTGLALVPRHHTAAGHEEA
ncbi:MAG: hypothetical protein JWP35_1135 [Caulobacter sp.]|nr:hypothetical protein [Caulobacter sp.]